MTENKLKEKEKQQYKPLKYFGLDRLLPYLKPYRFSFLFMACLGLVSTLASLILPLFQEYAINEFIGNSTLSGLPLFIIFYVLVLAAQIVSDLMTTYRTSFVELSVSRDLKRESFNHLQTLSFSYFNQNSVGYVHARVMSDTSRIGEFVSWGFMDGIWHISYIIGALIVMFTLRPTLAALVAVIIPFAAVLIALFQKKLVGINRHIRELNSRITGNFNEGITGAKTVKTLVIEDKMDKSFDVDALEMKKSSVRATHYRSALVATVTMSSSIALALVLWRGGIITLEGVLEIGTLSVFINYAMGIMEPIQWIVDAISNLITVQVNIERLTRLLETESDVTDTDEVKDKYGDNFVGKKENWEKLNGDVEFVDVSFKYPDGEEIVLDHFNLKVTRGSNIAIVGETGAGKSTLVNLVCRFYEPTSGKVLIDGRDARERSQLWLHSNIGYVLQTPYLFTGSVRDNLLYGKENATDEEIMQALRRVNADKIVERMEKGLDSNVGEGGDMLSTGEKQLISFARALIADPAILVLDEATSSVDTVTEYEIQQAIREVTQGRTSFVIAHRLSTVRNSDCILAVKDGRIVEKGTHDELMAARGYYYTLYTKQFEEESVAAVSNTQ